MSIRIEAFEGLRLFSLLELGLSQIYLNAEKLEAIENWFDPSDLSNRILSNEEYNQLWGARCDKSYNLLSQTNESERMTMQNKASNLHLYGASEDLSQLYYEDDCGNEYVLCNCCYEV